jgi:hypothetical protein
MKKPVGVAIVEIFQSVSVFLSITDVYSMACGWAVLIGTLGNALFPLKKRYSPSIFQKEMLDKRFTNRVNITLTKKRDRSRFYRGQLDGRW